MIVGKVETKLELMKRKENFYWELGRLSWWMTEKKEGVEEEEFWWWLWWWPVVADCDCLPYSFSK